MLSGPDGPKDLLIVLIDREVQDVTELFRIFMSGSNESFKIILRHKENNYIPQTLMIYSNHVDPQIPLKSGKNLPGHLGNRDLLGTIAPLITA